MIRPAQQDRAHRRRSPFPPTRRPDAAPVQLVGDSPQAEALGRQAVDDGQNSPREAGGVRAAESGAARLGGGQRYLGALADRLPLVLGHGCQDVQREPGSLRHVARHELGAAVHHVGDESDIARQPVEAGDDQHRPALGG